MPLPSAAPLLQAFGEWAIRSPEFGALYARFLSDSALLWQRAIEREQGKSAAPVVVPAAGDRRFAAPEWSATPHYDFLKQSYLLQAQFLGAAIEAAELPPQAKGQLRFYTRQLVDAFAPTNFAATNPEALKGALASNGETFSRGIQNLIADMAKGRVSNVDESAFEVGKNLAITPGAVVFENDLLQLIQYAPTTSTVHARPLLMVPPCINKYYVLDLQPENSFVRYAVGAGHTVFMVSWVNPTEQHAKISWDDYIERGVITAIDTVCAISRAEQISLLGFCVGGTMLATALAVLAARGLAPAASLTLLATLLDFSDTGEIGLFVTEEAVAEREAALGQGGILAGRELALVFSAMRDNDLIWPYVIGNYLKGERPAAFDILYWNADSTNLPGPMFAWYLRQLYLHNNLRERDALTVCGALVDLQRIGVPTYLIGTREDHIVPWQSAYRSVALLGKEVRFVLGASGHIAGIINPAAKNKRSYWVQASTVRASASLPTTPEAWMAAATETAGSWWTDWSRWLALKAGARRQAGRSLGTKKFPSLEPAPGRYVKHRIV